jgi:transcriptional regulator
MEKPVPRDANDLLHGTLDLLVLKALAFEPMLGYGLSKWIEQRTNDELEIVDSALYKALHRLEDAGAIDAEWGISENNRRAKYYSLTARGRQTLRAEVATWKRYVAAVSGVIEST